MLFRLLALSVLLSGIAGSSTKVDARQFRGIAPKYGLPPGISLSANGQLSGTPTADGLYVFQVKVNDSAGSSKTKTLVLFIASE